MIRVLVVDDSVVIRKLVADVLRADPDIEVVGTAVNGRAAVAKVASLSPDLITMDVEMPDMDGIDAVRALRSTGCRVPIIMFSTLTERGAAATLEALAAGATDYVTKPANVGSVTQSLEQVRGALVPRIKSLVPQGRGAAHRTPPALGATSHPAPASTATPRLRPSPAAGRADRSAPERTRAADICRLLVIGCSTGGPEALSTLLGRLPRLTVPVAVVQHMPPVFTAQFATRLDRQLDYPVLEAEHGSVMEPGTVYIAPGDFHLEVRTAGAGLMTSLNQRPAENYCRPAVDVLFRSAAHTTGAGTVAVVLTGMGHDGVLGARDLVRVGGRVLAQDRATSVVWGMPGAVAEAGLAEEILPLDTLPDAVLHRVVAADPDVNPDSNPGRTPTSAPISSGYPGRS